MQSNSSNVLLEQIDQRRDAIADTARAYLQKLKFDYPEVQFLTLNLKHKYGYSSLRVYTKKEDKHEDQQASPLDDPLASPF